MGGGPPGMQMNMPGQSKKAKKKAAKKMAAMAAAAAAAPEDIPPPPPPQTAGAAGAAAANAMASDNWPDSLKEYVAKCFNKCHNEIDKDQVEIILKGKITKAASDGVLHTKDWSNEPLPATLHSETRQ